MSKYENIGLDYSKKENRGMTTTSVQLPIERHKLLKKYHISMADCMRRGSQILLAERGVEGFENPMIYKNRVLTLTKILDETIEKLQKLEENHQKLLKKVEK